MADYKKCIEKYNSILEQFGQKLRVVDWQPKIGMTLSNGKVFSGRDLGLVRNMLTRNENDVWRQRFDEIIDNPSVAVEIKREQRSANGKKSWEKVGKFRYEENKHFLNPTGTPWNKGQKGVVKHGPRSEEFKRQLSESRKGSGNPMYGTRHSDDYKKAKSEFMKGRIERGEFTPNTNNRLHHRDIEYKGKTYRSSWEVLFAAVNPEYEYEKLRISYTLNNERHIYIVDFVDHNAKVAVEIKPIELQHKHNNDVKIAALKDWASVNGYKVLILNQDDIIDIRDKVILEEYEFSDEIMNKLLTIRPTHEINSTQRN